MRTSGAHYDAEAAKRAVELIEANVIQIHVNRAQELVMPEGDRVFSNWLKNIEAIVKTSAVPVIVKEVGFGFSREAIAQLESIGVAAIDISGTGGTNFAKIENGRSQRRQTRSPRRLGTNDLDIAHGSPRKPHPNHRFRRCEDADGHGQMFRSRS